MTTSTLACSVERLNHSYSTVSALEDVSFTLSPGTLTGLVGANGSGKSTLLRILAGVQRPSSGRIELFGEDAYASEEAGAGVGACIDGFSLWRSWTVGRTIEYIGALSGHSAEEAEGVLNMVDLAEATNSRLKTLSLGNRQKVLLAVAFLTGSRLILLDEPMSGLDPSMRVSLREAVDRVVADGRTVLMSSHDLHEVESMCNYLVALNKGRLAYAGPTSAFSQTSTMEVLRFDRHSVTVAESALSSAHIPYRRQGTDLIVHVPDGERSSSVLEGVGVKVLRRFGRTASLEESFLDHS